MRAQIQTPSQTGQLSFFFFKSCGAPRDLPSSPTRRSPDLDEAIAPKRYARLDAEFVASNKIELRTPRTRRYTLYLNEKLVDLARPVTIMTNGVLTYEGLVVPSTRTLLREARARQDPGTIFSASVSVTVPGSQ